MQGDVDARIEGHMTLMFDEHTHLTIPFHTHVRVSPTMNEADRKIVELAVDYAAYQASKAAMLKIRSLADRMEDKKCDESSSSS